MTHRRKGLRYEQIARKFLEQQGLVHLESNYHCRFGEVDLIMQQGKTICFVEVKYRNSLAYGGAAYTISKQKQQKIIKSALCYNASTSSKTPCRFDVLLLQGGPDQTDEINWIQSAFDATD